MQVGEVQLEVFERAPAGRAAGTILFLHDVDYLNGVDYPFVSGLAQNWRFVSPSHPGFGGSSLPAEFDCVDDLAYIHVDLLRQIGPSCVIGAGFGGWIAAEMAIRSTEHITALVLVDALGIKVADRTTADIADIFVLSPQEVTQLSWHDAERGTDEMALPIANGKHTEEELTQLLTNRRTAAVVGWKPFMHDPKLRGRLRRITCPTLVIWGASDGIVSPHYGEVFAQSIPHAEFALIEAAGHYPYLEQPATFLQHVEAFLK